MAPQPADRASYEAAQAALLRSLIRGDEFPDGFSADKAAAASRSLWRKRMRGVQAAWPALAFALGERFEARFEAYARAAPPPAVGHGFTDGLAFARTLARDEAPPPPPPPPPPPLASDDVRLAIASDDVRVELLLARAAVVGPPFRDRRGVFAGAAWLRGPQRIFVVVRAPVVGRRQLGDPVRAVLTGSTLCLRAWTSSRRTRAACARPGCRCSSRTTRPTRTSSRAPCRCSRSSSGFSCSVRRTSTGRCGRTCCRSAAASRSCSAAWRSPTAGAGAARCRCPTASGLLSSAASSSSRRCCRSCSAASSSARSSRQPATRCCCRSSTGSSGSASSRSSAGRGGGSSRSSPRRWSLLTRAVPVLLVFMILLFLTTEVWQVFSDISDAALIGVVALFVVLGSVFVAARLPNEVRALERDVNVDPPLRRRQRFNVGLVMFVSQGLQVLVVSVIVGLFFVAFGALALTPHVIEEWIQTRAASRRRAVVAQRRAAEGLGCAGGVQRPVLRDLGAHRGELPQGVPRRARDVAARDVPRSRALSRPAGRARSGLAGLSARRATGEPVAPALSRRNVRAGSIARVARSVPSGWVDGLAIDRQRPPASSTLMRVARRPAPLRTSPQKSTPPPGARWATSGRAKDACAGFGVPSSKRSPDW